jgi:hypothetical protein
VKRAILLALCAPAMGCAFGNRTARLTYPPADSSAQPEVAASVALLPPDDQRPEPRNVVGYVRNGLYMHTADVETNDDVKAWVAAALTTELRRAGIAVGDAAPGRPVVAVTVFEVHSNAYFSYSAKVVLDIAVRREGAPDAKKRIEGEGGSGVNWASTGDSHADALADAVRDAARKAAAAVRDSLGVNAPATM